MPTGFSHGIVAIALGKLFATKRMPARFWVLSIFCAVVPDADVVGFAFGIRYGDMLGHRGITHSFLFAGWLGLLVVLAFFRDLQIWSKAWWALVICFFAVTASHACLDALTDGGLGVAVFAPFDNTRYFFPWRPIEVSPLDIGSFLTSHGLAVIVSEIKWVWIPSAVLIVAAWAYRKTIRAGASPPS